MRKVLLSLLIASPLVAAASDSSPQIQTKKIDPSVEDLAHMYFFHDPYLEDSLTALISPQGVRAVVPAVGDQKKEMNDQDVVMEKARNVCARLKKAQTGEEFAQIFKQWDDAERAERRQHAEQLLARLDQDDRRALENYLNTEFRGASTSSVIDYDALFASRPFPSDLSNKILYSTCAKVTPAPGAQR